MDQPIVAIGQRRRKVFRGKPANQRDPNALLPSPNNETGKVQSVRHERTAGGDEHNPGPETSSTGGQRQGGQRQRSTRKAFVLPKSINAPQSLPKESQDELKLTPTQNPFEDSVFIMGNRVKEDVIRVPFSQSFCALIDIVQKMFMHLQVDDSSFPKALSQKAVNYYATGLLWLRFVTLKEKLSQELTTQEKDLLLIAEQNLFSVPDPILYQLKMVGEIQAVGRQHLVPNLPTLPTSPVKGFGVYYGRITVDNHNLYEEVPCLGVMAEALRAFCTDTDPGPYPSNLSTNDRVVNQNLLGYDIIRTKNPEAVEFIEMYDIKPDRFPEQPALTGFNLELMKAISKEISTSLSFRVSTLNLRTLSASGSLAQTIIQYPQPIEDERVLEKRGWYQLTSVNNQQLTICGGALAYAPQLRKTSNTRATAEKWCCISRPPESWIDNRNERRDLPEQYKAIVFSTPLRDSDQVRSQVIRSMLQTKR